MEIPHHFFTVVVPLKYYVDGFGSTILNKSSHFDHSRSFRKLRMSIEVDYAATVEQITHDEIVDRKIDSIVSLIVHQSQKSNAEVQLHLLAKTFVTLCLIKQSLGMSPSNV